MSDIENLTKAHAEAMRIALDAISFLRKMPLSPTTAAMIRQLEARAVAAGHPGQEVPTLPVTGEARHSTGLTLLEVRVFAGQAHISTPVEPAHYAKVVGALTGDGVLVSLHEASLY